jgi:hypothetical protein
MLFKYGGYGIFGRCGMVNNVSDLCIYQTTTSNVGPSSCALGVRHRVFAQKHQFIATGIILPRHNRRIDPILPIKNPVARLPRLNCIVDPFFTMTNNRRKISQRRWSLQSLPQADASFRALRKFWRSMAGNVENGPLVTQSQCGGTLFSIRLLVFNYILVYVRAPEDRTSFRGLQLLI